jgi:ubiquinone/menaquinone biosynthesis C-methylase UbiE
MFTQKDREKCERIYDRYYRGRKFHDSLYRERIRMHLAPGQRVLDAGCGRYLRFCKELSDMATVVGIDLDSVLETDNSSAPFAVRGDVGRLPFPSQHFDMVISRSVIEHLESPETVFREFWRVLKPGGKVVVITPNKYDYVSVIAAATPYRVHRSVVSRIFQVPEDDIFPTLYKANTLSAIRKAFAVAGFTPKELDTINHYPAYLMFSPMLFRLGVLYERITSWKMFRSLRGSLLCVFEKPKAVMARSGSPARAGGPLQGERVGAL